ncbi:pseudouridine synthase [soil metagenome]
MATIKLKKPAAPARGSSPSKTMDSRAPVRGAGAGVKTRPTLAQAQAERAEREARYQEQLRLRFGSQPPPASFTRRGGNDDRSNAPRGDRREDPRNAPRPRRDAAPMQPSSRPFEPRRDTGPRHDGAPPARGAFQPRRDSQPQRGDAPDYPRRDDRGQRGDAPQYPPRNAPPQRRENPPQRGDAPEYPRRDAPPRRDEAGPRRDPGVQRRDVVRQEPPPPGQFPAYEPRPRPRPRPPAGGPNTAFAPRARRDDDEDDYEREPAEHAPGSMRLSKRMSELGISSRREADEWIANGWVRVDDHVVSELGSRVVPGQRITVDAKAKYQQAQRVTVLINKPVGYVSGQAEDGYEPAVVLVTPANQWRDDHSGTRFLREHLKSLVPAGRLDIDSVGLLVLTQDGRIAKQLIGEDSDVEKEYLVRVASADGHPLSPQNLALLNHGLELDGEALRPAQVEWVNDDQLRFVLRQGKKRQIRRMCDMVGLQVLGLKRVRIGTVMLGDLPTGQWRYLRMDEGFAAPAPPASAE